MDSTLEVVDSTVEILDLTVDSTLEVVDSTVEILDLIVDSTLVAVDSTVDTLDQIVDSTQETLDPLDIPMEDMDPWSDPTNLNLNLRRIKLQLDSLHNHLILYSLLDLSL